MSPSDDNVFQYPPEDLEPDQLLELVESIFRKYTIQPSEHAYVALVLFTAYTHVAEEFDFAPRLSITSAEKRSGKSRTMEIISRMSANPLSASNASTSAVFRSLGDGVRTLLLDEADTIFGTKMKAEQNEDLRGLLNSGFQRGMPVLRVVGPNHEVQPFEVFSPVVIGGIGTMPDTITDRAVNIRLRRRKRTESVSPFRIRRDGPELERIREALAQWSERVRERVGWVEPRNPLEDRAADTWEPLLAVCEVVGGRWPERAHIAALAFSQEAAENDQDSSEGMELLHDIRLVLVLHRGDFIHSETLVELLKHKEDSRWIEEGLNTRRLATLLGEYGIKPKPDSQGKKRGYRIPTLNDVFERYLPAVVSEPSEPSETPPEQGERSDTGNASDTSMRQTKINRQGVSPAQGTYLTVQTLPDAMDGDDTEQSDDVGSSSPVWGQRPEPIGPETDLFGEETEPKASNVDASLDFVNRHGLTTPKDLAPATGVDNNSASMNLKRLVDKGKIQKVRHGVFAPLDWLEDTEADSEWRAS